jgi:hypothetical protein
MVATMIDPLLPPSVADRLDRLAALRSPKPLRQKRRKPAYTSKIITAGASTTALFTLVAGMGWGSGTGNAQSAPTAPTTSVTPVAPAPLVPTVVAPVPAVIAATAVPSTVAPLTVIPPPTVAPVPIPVPLPVPVPTAKLPVQKKAVKRASNTTTKSSG